MIRRWTQSWLPGQVHAFPPELGPGWDHQANKPGEEVILIPWPVGQKASSQGVPGAEVWESESTCFFVEVVTVTYPVTLHPHRGAFNKPLCFSSGVCAQEALCG